MTVDAIDKTICEWTEWANQENNRNYDIALLKIWIQFEKFLGELFVDYATGKTSEFGYTPKWKLKFESEEQLNVFLREGNRTYIEYIPRIEKLSKHLFENDPFQIIFLDANNKEAFNKMVSLRNYIAHESGEAKRKMIRMCFGGKEENFQHPNIYLQSIEKTSKSTYYTFYVNKISEMTRLVVDPPTDIL